MKLLSSIKQVYGSKLLLTHNRVNRTDQRKLFTALLSLIVLASMTFAVVAYAANLFSDNFSSGLGQWTTSSGVDWTGSYARVRGSNSRNTTMYTTISTTCYQNIALSYSQGATGLDNGEHLYVEWRVGTSGNWTQLASYDNNGWTSRSHDLGLSASDKSQIQIQYRTNANNNNDYGYIDNVLIAGDSIANNSIGDFVYNSGTGNPLSGVTVELWDDNNGSGTINNGDTLRTSTSTNGVAGANYNFASLPAGDYVVRAIAPNGYTPSSQDHAVSILRCGQDYNAADFGFVQMATINGRVWYDDDRDTFQTGDAGISGVTVELRQGANVITSNVTDDSGDYTLYAPAGNYTVHVIENTLPAGRTFSTTANNGASVTVAASDLQSVNFGYDDSGFIGDLVWLDKNGNGYYEPGSPDNEVGIDGVTVNLLYNGNLVDSDLTAGGGFYLFEGLPTPPGNTVRDEFDTVPYTYGNNNGSTDWSTDWIETGDDGNASTGNILVTGGQLRMQADNFSPNYDIIEREADLSNGVSAIFSFDFDCAGDIEYDDQVYVEVSGDGGGSWTVLERLDGTDELPSYGVGGPFSRSYDISAYVSNETRIRFRQTEFRGSDEYFYVDNAQISFSGPYTVAVDESNAALTGYTATTPPTREISLNSGGTILDADFGFGPFAVVSGLIFQDTDYSSAHNGSEPGLPGVTVELYSGTTTTTDDNGFYFFRGIKPGTYNVKALTAPAGFRATSSNPLAVPVTATGLTYADNNIGFNYADPVGKPIYLHENDELSRVELGGIPNDRSLTIDNNGQHTWTLTPPLAQPLALTGIPIVVGLYIDPVNGANGNAPDVHVTLSYGAITLGTYSVDNIESGIQLYNFIINPTVPVIPAGAELELRVDVDDADSYGVDGSADIYYNSVLHPSQFGLPVYSYLQVDEHGTFDATYPGDADLDTFIVGHDAFVRVTASDPFGAYDISDAILTIPGVVTGSSMSIVDSTDPNRTFETQLSGLP